MNDAANSYNFCTFLQGKICLFLVKTCPASRMNTEGANFLILHLICTFCRQKYAPICLFLPQKNF